MPHSAFLALRPTPASTGPLSDEQQAFYADHGWVAARGFFGPADMRMISDWTDALAAAPELPGREMVYHEVDLRDETKRVIQRIENFCPYHPGFDALVRRGRLTGAVEQLLGAESVLFKEKINYKMPGGAGFEPHQDQQAGWSTYAPLFITALVCIDAATIENGCLEMAEGARATGLIGPEWAPLTPEQLAGRPLVSVPTAPGDVLFFDSYAPHASKPNFTEEARRILYLTYNRADAGDHREAYFTDKRASFPPDVERAPGAQYRFRV